MKLINYRNLLINALVIALLIPLKTLAAIKLCDDSYNRDCSRFYFTIENKTNHDLNVTFMTEKGSTLGSSKDFKNPITIPKGTWDATTFGIQDKKAFDHKLKLRAVASDNPKITCTINYTASHYTTGILTSTFFEDSSCATHSKQTGGIDKITFTNF